MPATFHEDGIRFRYPENWKLERQQNDEGWTVTLQSPETAFLLLSLREDMPDPTELAETALEALKEEYEDLEADDSADPVASKPAVGHDIRFFAFDLTNTCWIRSFSCPRGTVLLLCQVNDLELQTNEPVLRAICASLELAEE